MRTVVETECSVDDIFDMLKAESVEASTKKYTDGRAFSEKLKAADKVVVVLFQIQELNATTSVRYRELSLPWYVPLY